MVVGERWQAFDRTLCFFKSALQVVSSRRGFHRLNFWHFHFPLHIMGVKQKKSTIKFQRTKLKQTIERRRQHNKLKQQINRRKERRAARAKENGTKGNKQIDIDPTISPLRLVV